MTKRTRSAVTDLKTMQSLAAVIQTASNLLRMTFVLWKCVLFQVWYFFFSLYFVLVANYFHWWCSASSTVFFLIYLCDYLHFLKVCSAANMVFLILVFCSCDWLSSLCESVYCFMYSISSLFFSFVVVQIVVAWYVWLSIFLFQSLSFMSSFKWPLDK